jgi:peptidoglycan hydrolase-like protein with peptidoglycan-binding domain
MMKRTLLTLGVSALLAMPLLVNGQLLPSTPGTGSAPGAGASGSGTRMEQEERRGQTEAPAGEVRQVQERLKEAGFHPGPTDGQLGAQTKDAIKEYQKAHGLPQTGQLDEPTREMLMVQKADGVPGERQTPGGSIRERTSHEGSMPGGRIPGEPGAGSTLPGGSSSTR